MIRKENWTEKEIKILIENFPLIGTNGCSKLLNRNPNSISVKTRKLGIKFCGIPIHYQYENFSITVQKSKNLSDVARNMGMEPLKGNRDTIKKYISLYKIDINHFDYSREQNGKNNMMKHSFDEIFQENSNYHRGGVKKILFKQNLKKEECELCGQGIIWMNKKLSLILDHINGNNMDNRLENLRIICPNCDSTLDTHSGKNKKANKDKSNISNKISYLITIKKEKKKSFCSCGNEKSKNSNNCWKCYNEHNRIKKVEQRPSIDILIQDIQELGYVGTGKKYGVSDNCIRKWLHKYINDNKKH